MIESQILNEVEIPQESSKYYNDRIISFFEWFKSKYKLPLNKLTIKNNLKLGELIIKNQVIEYDLETILSIYGYDLFREYSYDEFIQNIDTYSDFKRSIIEGKVLIGYTNDFSKIVLVTKSFIVSDAVHIIIN